MKEFIIEDPILRKKNRGSYGFVRNMWRFSVISGAVKILYVIFWRNLSPRIPLPIFFDRVVLYAALHYWIVMTWVFLRESSRAWSGFLGVTFRARVGLYISNPDPPTLSPTLLLPTAPSLRRLLGRRRNPPPTNPIQPNPVSPVRFSPVLPSIFAVFRRSGAFFSSIWCLFCGFGVGGWTPGPGAVRRLRSIRSHPPTRFDPTGKVLLDWFLVFAARSARLMCGFLGDLILRLVGVCRKERDGQDELVQAGAPPRFVWCFPCSL